MRNHFITDMATCSPLEVICSGKHAYGNESDARGVTFAKFVGAECLRHPACLEDEARIISKAS